MVALFVFFGALAGIGYVDPEAQALNKAAAAADEFVVGGPVFDRQESQKQLERQIAERRALEEQWARKKRPNSVSRAGAGVGHTTHTRRATGCRASATTAPSARAADWTNKTSLSVVSSSASFLDLWALPPGPYRCFVISYMQHVG
ncbi:hypothetical protein VHUM_04280 [Vanrija humicola]|uniref:Uncharacterized protein n=1 Tax=Vanrija humicola TaxID=5417 RepID=A0A7D8YU39_VANHU|nr:hypothetical protein VHUM_04280 [Vanrija humicola]